MQFQYFNDCVVDNIFEQKLGHVIFLTGALINMPSLQAAANDIGSQQSNYGCGSNR